ncbi:MAG: class I SAM-dependent methyltransferase [Chthoniobacteraceae bacterium]
MSDVAQQKCRLCGGRVDVAFSKKVMGKYDVAFLRCMECDSMQTESPYWLEESYANGRRGEDLHAVGRCQRAQMTIYFMARLLGLGKSARILDFGGGNGLLVRMLRNIGLNAYRSDKYAENCFAVGFEDEPGARYDMVTCFEVFEHLPFPQRDLEEIFGRKPQMVYASTCLYRGEGASWDYLCANSGGHVFFYSMKAIEWIGKRFGYDVFVDGVNLVFYRGSLSGMKRFLLSKVIFGKSRTLNAVFPFLKVNDLTNDDHELMRKLGLSRN